MGYMRMLRNVRHVANIVLNARMLLPVQLALPTERQLLPVQLVRTELLRIM